MKSSVYMASPATFVFYGSLTDFLPKKRKETVIYLFTGTPSVKDAIETIGVPHVEVDVILVNNKPVDFTYLLSPTDLVYVYPKGHPAEKGNLIHLIKPFPAIPAFILDVHLGKLARLLRMLGFDVLYEQNYTDVQIAEIAFTETRIVLTRDIPLLKRKIIEYGYWLRSQQPEQQLSEVLHYFNLIQAIQPFSRCIACNGLIEKVDKASIAHRLEPQTKQFFDEFYQCCQCKRIYWKGSHYEKMEKFIQHMLNLPQLNPL